MSVKIQQIGPEDLPLYASVSIAYEVMSIYRVEAVEGEISGLVLTEESVSPYIKDYDAQAQDDDRPDKWANQFDLSKWRFFLAMDGERAAGGAAHLPGVMASLTAKPVLGVPMKGWATEGLDALLSIVQMPPGVPVATVAVGSAGARNAACLAARILALTDAKVASAVEEYRRELARGGR